MQSRLPNAKAIDFFKFMIDPPAEVYKNWLPKEHFKFHIVKHSNKSPINDSVVVIVPETDMIYYNWFASPLDKLGFVEYATEVQHTYLPYGTDGLSIDMFDVEEELEAMQSLGRLIMVLIYGFVAMLTLIGLTNVISTISTNVRSRSREFAILRSIGMTDSGLHRMLNLESILCSAKSIFWGVPFGLAGAYVVYLTLELPAEYAFEIPWLSILQCVIAVFVITWVVMRYCASRLRGGNIVETIRMESGM